MALIAVPLAAAWSVPVFSVETRLVSLAAVYVPTLWVAWVGGVVERFAVSSNGDVSLWYPWPDGVPALLFMSAFLLVCRDLWRLEQGRVSAPVGLWGHVRRGYARLAQPVVRL
jgi:hypothetical protein